MGLGYPTLLPFKPTNGGSQIDRHQHHLCFLIEQLHCITDVLLIANLLEVIVVRNFPVLILIIFIFAILSILAIRLFLFPIGGNIGKTLHLAIVINIGAMRDPHQLHFQIPIAGYHTEKE